MQIYSGHTNKRAKSQSTYIRDFEKGLKKTFARNLKRVVRQEGIKECSAALSEPLQTDAELKFEQAEDDLSYVSRMNMEDFERGPDSAYYDDEIYYGDPDPMGYDSIWDAYVD